MRAANASPTPQDVASAIVAAAHAEPPPLRLQVGEDAHRLYQARRTLDDETLAANGLAQWFEENATEDVVFYATPVGDEVRGRQAVADTLERFFSQANAEYRIDGDLVEHGSFVSVFLSFGRAPGRPASARCSVSMLTTGSRASGESAASDQETRRLTSEWRKMAPRDDFPMDALSLRTKEAYLPGGPDISHHDPSQQDRHGHRPLSRLGRRRQLLLSQLYFEKRVCDGSGFSQINKVSSPSMGPPRMTMVPCTRLGGPRRRDNRSCGSAAAPLGWFR